MKLRWKLAMVILSAAAATAQADGIDGRAVLGGALGGGAGAALGSAVGGREGAIIGAGVGGAAGAAIATRPSRESRIVHRAAPVVVEEDVVVVHERERDCWPPGHCKHHKHWRKYRD